MSGLRGRLRPSWDLALATVFLIGSGWTLMPSLVYPGLIGSHAVLYTAAAQAMVAGGDPWTVGPHATVFAGPPTMPLSFLPFVALPDLAIRVAWIAIDAAVAAWALRRIGLPGYWIAFPPIVQTIVLGHPEVLLLGLLVAGGALSGLSILIKPYAVFPLLAERRWRALGVATATLLVTAPFLPWQRFFAELPEIVATIIRQNNGDPVFGDPVWMAVGALSLLSLGWRRGLWLAVPVMWPYAQPNYKVMTVPALPPLLALIWAIPIPGHTLTGVVVLATLLAIARRRALPAWVEAGIREPVRLKLPSEISVGSLDLPRASMAGSA